MFTPPGTFISLWRVIHSRSHRYRCGYIFRVGWGGVVVVVVALFHLAPSRPPHGPSYLLQFILSGQFPGSRKEEVGRMKKHTYQPSQFHTNLLPTSPSLELTHVATSPLAGDWKVWSFFPRESALLQWRFSFYGQRKDGYWVGNQQLLPYRLAERSCFSKFLHLMILRPSRMKEWWY